MTHEFLTSLAQRSANQWTLILPELLIAGLALLLLILELILPRAFAQSIGTQLLNISKTQGWVPVIGFWCNPLGNLFKRGQLIPFVSIILQIGILYVGIIYATDPKINGTQNIGTLFYGMIKFSPEGQLFRIFFVVISIIVHAIAMISLPKQKVPRTEFFHIVLVITAAMMLLANTSSFLMLFVALETVTVGFYILVSYYRTSAFSLEAGLKYLVLGALSSGLLLFGIVLLYGMTGAQIAHSGVSAQHGPDALSFSAIGTYLQHNPTNFVANLGVLLVLAGVSFKIGLVPFQIWIPDVYQGAPTPVTAFLSVGSKIAGFAILLTLLPVIVPCFRVVVPMLTVLTFATIIFGNLAALTQHNIKRLMGLSGVSHAGFIMMAIVAAIYTKDAPVTPIFVYLIAYALASFAVFGVMALVAGERDAEQEMTDYHGLSKRSPFLAGVLVVGLGSLAGLPPLFGFMGKLLVFMSVFRSELYGLFTVAILAVVVSIYYYFAWVRAAFFKNWDATPVPDEASVTSTDAIRVPFAMRLLLIVLALASVVFGVYQKPIMDLLALLNIS